ATYYQVSEEIGVPILQEVEKSMGALGHLVGYARFQERRNSRIVERLSQTRPKRAAEILGTATGNLTEADSKRVLQSYGLPITLERLVTSADEAVAAAHELGYPLAMKLMS